MRVRASVRSRIDTRAGRRLYEDNVIRYLLASSDRGSVLLVFISCEGGLWAWPLRLDLLWYVCICVADFFKVLSGKFALFTFRRKRGNSEMILPVCISLTHSLSHSLTLILTLLLPPSLFRTTHKRGRART